MKNRGSYVEALRAIAVFWSASVLLMLKPYGLLGDVLADPFIDIKVLRAMAEH